MITPCGGCGPRARSCVSAQPRWRRHERLTTQHGGLWYHLWVGRRRGWARSEWGAPAQVLPGARGAARGRAHHSVSRVVFVACVFPGVALSLCCPHPLARVASLRAGATLNSRPHAPSRGPLVSPWTQPNTKRTLTGFHPHGNSERGRLATDIRCEASVRVVFWCARGGCYRTDSRTITRHLKVNVLFTLSTAPL